MLLRDDVVLRQHLKGSLLTILGTLDDLNSQDAESFVKWTSKKAAIYKKALSEEPFPNLPNNMTRGDIVLCDLGINIPPEFSDLSGRHFVVFWKQQGHCAIIIPITSKKPVSKNSSTISIGKVDGLKSEENYVKLDSIRSVSLRRLSRISGTRDGKIHSEIVKAIVIDGIRRELLCD